eukprot:scaffold870_cov268-Pinguiococcus_pyrenoidosus.AAC.61
MHRGDEDERPAVRGRVDALCLGGDSASLLASAFHVLLRIDCFDQGTQHAIPIRLLRTRPFPGAIRLLLCWCIPRAQVVDDQVGGKKQNLSGGSCVDDARYLHATASVRSGADGVEDALRKDQLTQVRQGCPDALSSPCMRFGDHARSLGVQDGHLQAQNSKDFSPSASSTPAPSPCEPRRTALTPPNIDTIGSRPEKSASSTRRHQAARDRTIATMHGYISFVKWQSKASQIRAKCAARVLSPFVSSHSMAPVITARASPRAAASSISAYSGTDSSATQLSQ